MRRLLHRLPARTCQYSLRWGCHSLCRGNGGQTHICAALNVGVRPQVDRFDPVLHVIPTREGLLVGRRLHIEKVRTMARKTASQLQTELVLDDTHTPWPPSERLPYNFEDQRVEKVVRATSELGAKGVMIYTNVEGRPLDAPELQPFFDEVARRNGVVWLHPTRGAAFPD